METIVNALFVVVGIVALYNILYVALGFNKRKARQAWAKENVVMEESLRKLHEKHDIMFLREQYGQPS